MLHLGRGQEVKTKGWTAARCERCQRVLPFRVFQDITTHSINFIDVWTSRKIVIVCDFCGSGARLDAMPRMKPHWRRKDGLQALVDATNPELGAVDEAAPPTDSQLKALLDTIAWAARQRSFGSEVGFGTVAGLVLGAAMGFGTGWGLNVFGVMGNAKDGVAILGILGLAIFAVIGVVLGLLYDRRQRVNQDMRKALRDAIRQRGLDAAHLLDVARQNHHPAEVAIAELPVQTEG